MSKKNFFSWYYLDGTGELIGFVKNILAYYWRYFGIPDHLRHLFSPWKRDVEVSAERGFHPLIRLNFFIINSFSRILGMIVKLGVISTGIVVESALFIAGITVIAFFVICPVLLLLAVWLFLNASNFWLVWVCLIFLGIVMRAHFVYQRSLYRDLSLKEISEQKFFGRIANRIGISADALAIIFRLGLDDEESKKIFASVGLDADDVLRAIKWEIDTQEQKENRQKFWSRARTGIVRQLGIGWKYAYTVKLDRFATDLTEFDPSAYSRAHLVGHKKELGLVEIALQNQTRNNVMLVGSPGAGKKSLIHMLARNIREGKADAFFEDKRIVLLDLGSAIGQVLQKGGNVENFLGHIFSEAAYAGNVILVIENIEEFLGKDSSNGRPNIAPILQDFLNVPTFQIIATSTTKEYHHLIERHDNLMKYFDVVEMSDFTEEEALRVVLHKFRPLEAGDVLFTYAGLKEIVKKAGRYGGLKPLPEKSVELAEEVFNYWKAGEIVKRIDAEIVEDFVSIKTGIPVGKISDSERGKLLNLEDDLRERVIGQEEAIADAASAVRKIRSGIARANKPAGSFLFLGPTGVGKTETAKALADVYFGDEKKIVRLDMSEFQNPSAVESLIGSQALNEPGRLGSLMRDNPYTVLLIDEIEKAYPKILDLFLQVLDEGYLTDAFGDKIDFRNCVVIATSNAGSSLIRKLEASGVAKKDVEREVINDIIESGTFRPEFLNRFDKVVVYNILNQNELLRVTNMLLDKLATRVKNEKDIEVNFASGVAEKIVELGYNEIFGARSIEHFIGNTLENTLVTKIIAGGQEIDDKTINVSAEEIG
ncbi:MAG: AAA family ATPase [Candidatus Moranbacteria bacterium]|nr:AAA family ATPase [Candidatus Moranbacteria bacterium]